MRNTSGLWRGGGPGRAPGQPNRASREARELCRRLVADPEYRARFEQRWRNGDLAPAVETMVWAYAFGKPSQQFEVTSHGISLAQIIAGTVPREDEDQESDWYPPNGSR